MATVLRANRISCTTIVLFSLRTINANYLPTSKLLPNFPYILSMRQVIFSVRKKKLFHLLCVIKSHTSVQKGCNLFKKLQLYFNCKAHNFSNFTLDTENRRKRLVKSESRKFRMNVLQDFRIFSIFPDKCTLKPRYSEKVYQNLFVHYIE